MKTKSLAVLVLATMASSAVFAQVKPEDQIHYRQGAMQVIARSTGALGAMVKGDVPYNKEMAQRHAAVLADVSDLPLVTGAFGPGTDKGAPTKADPKVWSEADKFKTAYERMATEARKLPAAAGDPATLKTAFGDFGKTCKGCHDDFRQK